MRSVELATTVPSILDASSSLCAITEKLPEAPGSRAAIGTSGPGGAPLFEVNVGGNVGTTTGAALTISNNLVQALAEGNYAYTNTLNVSGNALSQYSNAAVSPGNLVAISARQRMDDLTASSCFPR